MSTSKPAVMLVIAGPSGSGKSTVFPTESFGVQCFNVDHWCAKLSGSYQSISPEIRSLGGQECERFVEKMIETKTSFAVETTLRGRHAIDQARLAKLQGMYTIMNYISTESPEIAIERVRKRGLLGGHSAPPSLIAEIYEKSHLNLSLAIEVFHQVNVFTSPKESKSIDGVLEWYVPRLEARFIDQELVLLEEPIPQWLAKSSVSAMIATYKALH